MKKIDYKKEFKQYYAPSAKEFSIIEVPEWKFLKIDGYGDPNKSVLFQQAIETLYPVAYTIKFYCKKNLDLDFSVMPLEGLWWADNMDDYLAQRKDKWKWTVMILQPDFVTSELFTIALDTIKKKGKKLPALSLLRFESYTEGLAAQIAYNGPYADETNTIKELHSFINKQGYSLHGFHHEIYLNDSRRVLPEKLKTIIRQPMKK